MIFIILIQTSNSIVLRESSAQIPYTCKSMYQRRGWSYVEIFQSILFFRESLIKQSEQSKQNEYEHIFICQQSIMLLKS